MRLFNTLTQNVEQLDFPDGVVRMYVCGITPYDTSHMGHARVGIVYDTLYRYLQFAGYEVRYVQNVTDIDDPLFERAKRDGVQWDVLGKEQTEHYLRSLARVNVPRPPFYIPATEVIEDMQPIIQDLIDQEHAYIAGGAVYYDVKSFPAFGNLFHADYATMLETANERGNNPDDPRKNDPLDFVLWQPSAEDEPSWPSPWGAGRPGWHIECSTIATKYLGPQLDIHGGGGDLIFPHHAAEIAQAEPANGVSPFVRCWMHVGMVYLDGEKMSKSLGNMVFVDEVLETHRPDALRMAILCYPYREPFEYSEDAVAYAEERLARMREALDVESASDGERLDGADERARFVAALEDDFDTAAAIGVLADLADATLEVARSGGNVEYAQATLRELAGVLGLTLED
jgi:L-cysteine:1D-myo-inositol 2-amino-2-deoxy-alpha-D-glucopyranoside ligase